MVLVEAQQSSYSTNSPSLTFTCMQAEAQQHAWSSSIMATLPADAEAAIARAHLALECAQQAALCMLRCSLCKGGRVTAATQRCVALLCKPLAAFAQCFALTPLPFPGRRRCSYLLYNLCTAWQVAQHGLF